MTFRHALIVTRDSGLTIRLSRGAAAKRGCVIKVAVLLGKSAVSAIRFNIPVLMFWLTQGKHLAVRERNFNESVMVVPRLRFYREAA